jgi:hypothetical protein
LPWFAWPWSLRDLRKPERYSSSWWLALSRVKLLRQELEQERARVPPLPSGLRELEPGQKPPWELLMKWEELGGRLMPARMPLEEPPFSALERRCPRLWPLVLVAVRKACLRPAREPVPKPLSELRSAGEPLALLQAWLHRGLGPDPSSPLEEEEESEWYG